MSTSTSTLFSFNAIALFHPPRNLHINLNQYFSIFLGVIISVIRHTIFPHFFLVVSFVLQFFPFGNYYFLFFLLWGIQNTRQIFLFHNGRLIRVSTTCYDLCLLMPSVFFTFPLLFPHFFNIGKDASRIWKVFSFTSLKYVYNQSERLEKNNSKNAFFIISALRHFENLLFYQKMS